MSMSGGGLTMVVSLLQDPRMRLARRKAMPAPPFAQNSTARASLNSARLWFCGRPRGMQQEQGLKPWAVAGGAAEQHQVRGKAQGQWRQAAGRRG